MRAVGLALALLLIPAAAHAEHPRSGAPVAHDTKGAGHWNKPKQKGHQHHKGGGPQVAVAPTVLSIVPPRAATVLVSDGPAVMGQVSAPASLAVPSGKAYSVTAVRGNKVLWSAQVVASGGTIDIVWGRGPTPAIQQAAPPVIGQPPIPPPPGPMAGPAFKKLLSVVSAESFETDKRKVVETAAAHHFFTVAQVGRILDELTFDTDKVNALTALRPRIVDPENGFQLSSHFDFASSRQKALALFSQ